MSKFYGTMGYATLVQPTYTCYFQTCLYSEEGQPIDMDWQSTIDKYAAHQAITSVENPYLNDSNAYYGTDLTLCSGYDEDSNPKFCTYGEEPEEEPPA